MMILLNFLAAVVATFGFAVLFSAPKKEWAFCSISGALGWIVYYTLIQCHMNFVAATTLATIALTILSRVFAVVRRQPGTVYLLPGIFPLVPGAGIYYTSYYLITGEMELFSQKGVETLETAAAIVFGIIFAFAIPQNVFHLFARKTK